ncbi:hypothetical protein [Acinetobacter proteolyticus]|uniref:Uncharacterized protein n=1 Tax=Acinetobacter proteolyticus TaxID=1776741 RepID=A0A2N0WI92_9GAMM|nr:hypothetical protein [Acinetobacter proteolyticus]PKF35517.1 hypothetical protein CW311_04300 [Acinetobacter proteolyticus]
MSKRKPYNPKKLQQLALSKAHQLYTLSMTFMVDDVNESIDKWRSENNWTEKESTPKHVVYEVYHGDLIICLRNELIPLVQEWFFGIDSHYYNLETDEALTVPYQFTTPLMSFEEFRFGSEIKVNRGHGLKTRWKGINDELNQMLLAEVPEGFIRVKSQALLQVKTKFNSPVDYQHFIFAKQLRDASKKAA